MNPAPWRIVDASLEPPSNAGRAVSVSADLICGTVQVG